MSARWDIWGYRFFSLLGCALVAAGMYCYYAPLPRANVEAFEADRKLADCVPGQTRDVVFQLYNRSSAPIRILNLTGC